MAAAGFDVVRFRPIPVRGTSLAVTLRLLRDLFIFGIDCHVRRPNVV